MNEISLGTNRLVCKFKLILMHSCLNFWDLKISLQILYTVLYVIVVRNFFYCTRL